MMIDIYNESNTIDVLEGQINALLDLMQMCDSSTSIESINTASEMCSTVFTELMAEVNKIESKVKEFNNEATSISEVSKEEQSTD